MQVADMINEVRQTFPAAVVKDHGIDLGVTGTAATADARRIVIGHVRICRTGDVRFTAAGKWCLAVCMSREDTMNVLWLVARGLHVVAERTGYIDEAGHYRLTN